MRRPAPVDRGRRARRRNRADRRPRAVAARGRRAPVRVPARRTARAARWRPGRARRPGSTAPRCRRRDATAGTGTPPRWPRPAAGTRMAARVKRLGRSRSGSFGRLEPRFAGLAPRACAPAGRGRRGSRDWRRVLRLATSVGNAARAAARPHAQTHAHAHALVRRRLPVVVISLHRDERIERYPARVSSPASCPGGAAQSAGDRRSTRRRSRKPAAADSSEPAKIPTFFASR